ncbi:MAG: heavy-metal-associated domain-containing protein [Chloroflexi bacterium]|nr:heavy-metal-associated domain-containing protein [Chloroflexota bacterium]
MEEGTSKTVGVTLPIYGLGCGGGGALAVERALSKSPGVKRAYVNPLTEMAYIQYDPALTGPERLEAAIVGLGFGAGAGSPGDSYAR